jgi:hypothetical protein
MKWTRRRSRAEFEGPERSGPVGRDAPDVLGESYLGTYMARLLCDWGMCVALKGKYASRAGERNLGRKMRRNI